MITAEQIPELARKAGSSVIVRPNGTVGYFTPSDFGAFLLKFAQESAALALSQKGQDENT